METTTAITICATPDDVFAIAADVESWPRILPHYRWVRRLSGNARDGVVEMAAWRDLYPMRWTARVTSDPERQYLAFHHIAGPARGMDVEWRFTPVAEGQTYAVIWHRYQSRRRVIGPLYTWVVCRVFVENVATKTLRRIKRWLESGDRSGPRA